MIDVNNSLVSNILPKRKLTFILLLYHALVFILFALTYHLMRPTYPILGMMVGYGRFDDWSNTIFAALKYPEVSEYICTIPWMHVPIFKLLHKYLSPFNIYIVYITAFLATLVPIYRFLKIKIGSLNSLLILFTYPIIFSFWRGNTDLIIFSLILNSLIYLINGNNSKSLKFLWVAATFKPFVVFYILLFHPKILLKNIKLITLLMVLSIIVIYSVNINFLESLTDFTLCAKKYTDEYIIGESGSLHNNSIWGLFKFINYIYFVDTDLILTSVNKYSFYPRFSALIILISYFFIRNFVTIFNESLVNNIFILNILMAFLLPISPDYRLYLVSLSMIMIVIGIGYFDNNKFIIICLLLFILLPKHFIWYEFTGVNFTINTPINAISLFILLLYFPIKSALSSFKLRQR